MSSRNNKRMTIKERAKEKALDRLSEPTAIQIGMLDYTTQMVSVQSGGKTERISIEEALSRKIIETAMKGSPHAQGLAFKQIKEAQEKQTLIAQVQVEVGRLFKEKQKIALDRAVAEGGDPDKVLPHPDDIEIDETSGYEFTGPFDEESLDAIKETVAIRDCLLLQYELENRLDWEPHVPTKRLPETPPLPGMAFIWFTMLNNSLPLRFRLSDSDVDLQIWKLHRKTKRQMLKETYQSWSSAGIRLPRGYRTPPVRLGVAFTDASCSMLRELRHRGGENKRLGDRQLMDIAHRGMTDAGFRLDEHEDVYRVPQL
ncbi:MAG: hypothetical protein AAFO98_02440 [Pseudomonadota bacterium]